MQNGGTNCKGTLCGLWGDYYKYHGSMNINVIENYCPLKVIELSEKHREQLNA